MTDTTCRLATVTVAIAAVFTVGARTPASQQRPPAAGGEASIAELWIEPQHERELFYGVGGKRLAPDSASEYKVIALKVGGFSTGYTVVDDTSREWSAKFPPEAAVEVTLSRIHWALGYHQPPVYLLREWTAAGAKAPNPQLPARFREKSPDFHGLQSDGAWAFDNNPFVGTRPLQGLLVLQALFENQDIKASNNVIYALTSPAEGARRWYVIRDLGYSLGRAGFNGPRNHIETFERGRFIQDVVGGKVQFNFGGRHRKLLDTITVDDVVWICRRLDRLTDRQWRDAFRAGAFEDSIAQRFIAVIKARIAEAMALQDQSTHRSGGR